MLELANMLMLALIVLLLLGSVLRGDRLLSALFLIGFTQIGSVYPLLGRVRFELVVGILLLMTIFLSADARARLMPNGNPVARQVNIFILVVILSVPFAFSLPDAVYWLVYYFKRCFVLYFGVIALLGSERKIRSLVNIYLACILWLSLFAFFNYLSGVHIVVVDGVQRVRGATGLFSNPNGLANTMVGALPVAYYLFLYHWRKSFKAWLLLAVCVFAVATVFMSGSRGGFIGLLSALFAMVLLSNKRSVAVVLVAIVLLLSLAFVGDDLLGRYATILEGADSGKSANSRLVGLQHGFSMLIRRPVLGVGVGCYPAARGRWFGWNFWAHNTYGQLMGELGIVGILAWGYLIYFTIRGARGVRRSLKLLEDNEERKYLYYLSLGIEVAMYARLVLGMTTHSMHIFFWYFNAGLVVCMQRIIEPMQLEEREVGENNSGEALRESAAVLPNSLAVGDTEYR